MKLTCNYAVAHFLPYAVTEEFVNIGVILHCRETGYLDFRLSGSFPCRSTCANSNIPGSSFRCPVLCSG